MPKYIEKSVDLDGCYHSGTDRRTEKQTRKDRATQPMDPGRLRWATFIEYLFFLIVYNIWLLRVVSLIIKHSICFSCVGDRIMHPCSKRRWLELRRPRQKPRLR